MKKILATAAVAGLAVVGFAGPSQAAAPTCNWGELTSDAIAGGFDQGGHASSFDTPRVGLPNLFGKGDLNATCEALS